MVLVLGLGVAGCKRAPEENHAPAPAPVSVSCPVQREVTDYAEFTARTAAVESVEVRARVWGYLEKVNFKEGALVRKGDVLFAIDPRTYQAELAQAEARITEAEARRTNLQIDYERIQAVFAKGAASAQEADKATANLAEAAAAVAAATAARDLTKLNLGFTKITAPIAGRVGRALVTEGNLIQSGQSGGTLLTTIVSVDPIHAYFDVDEGTVLRVKQLIREGQLGMPDKVEIPVWLGLANEEGYPHRGTMDFTDNQVNPRTGTLRVRGVFPNPDEALTPGFFARVRVPISASHPALLVTERALDTDQGQRILYGVDAENRVVTRPVQLGAMHDGLREITAGLSPGERVIINGIQMVRPGALVEPNLVEMPTVKAHRADETAPQPNVTSNH
jgi:RND family efflux transporter MFP subunit